MEVTTISNLLKSDSIKAKITSLLQVEPNDIMLDSVWDYITSYFGYDISSQDRKEEADSTDTDMLFLFYKPVTAIKEITIGNSPIDLTDLEIYAGKALKYLNGYFAGSKYIPMGSYMGLYPQSSIICEYTAGFTEDSLPSDLIYASSLLYKKLSHDLSSQGVLSSYKIDTISYGYKSQEDIQSNIDSILSRYL